MVAALRLFAGLYGASGVRIHHTEPELAAWQYLCGGFITGEGKGFGRAVGVSDEDSCLYVCEDHAGCNVVSWDDENQRCWLDRAAKLPSPSECDGNPNGHSYWLDKGDSDADESYAEPPAPPPPRASPPAPRPPPPPPPPAPRPVQSWEPAPRPTPPPPAPRPEPVQAQGDSWHFVCSGYVPGELPGREGFGQAKLSRWSLNVDGCKAACDKHGKCNAFTFDAGTKVCWMEKIPAKPSKCDGNSNGRSYWRGKGQADKAPAAKSWQYVCNGFVTGHLHGRHGFGKAKLGKRNMNVDGCKAACDAHGRCNSFTFDTGAKNCWMERIPGKPSKCDNNRNGQSYWKGV